MANPQELLARRVQDGLAAAFGEAYADADPAIRPSQHADFQANVALSLAGRCTARRGRSPPSWPVRSRSPTSATNPR